MLVIDDLNELRALVKALSRLKFDAPRDEMREIVGSPLVASVLNKAYDALIAGERAEYRDGVAGRLVDKRLIDKRGRIYRSVRQYIEESGPHWSIWTRPEREAFVRILLSPYTADDDLI